MSSVRATVIFVFLCVMFCAPVQARAGEGDVAAIHELDVSRFPQVRFFLSLSNYMGALPDHLNTSDLTLREDGNAVSEFTITGEPVGYRLVVVLFPDWPMQMVSSRGESNLDAIRRIAGVWLATQHGGGLNDYSLVTPGGTVLVHNGEPQALAEAIQRAPLRVPAERPIAVLFSNALGLAGDPLPRAGMRSAILLLTAKAPDAENQAVCPRLREQGFMAYGVWTGNENGPSFDALSAWASACGGYAGSLQNEFGVRSLLEGIGTQQNQYIVDYRSTLSKNGDHALTVSIQHGSYSAESRPLTFPVRVQPPAVTIVGQMDAIRRSGTDPLQPAEEYLPQAENFEAVVSFPDGHPRNIVAMKFFVDGKQIYECITLPCPALRWDLRPYVDSGEHTLRLSVQDELGLTGETPEHKVYVEIAYPSATEMLWARYGQAIMTALVIVLATCILVIVPNLVGQRSRRPTIHPARRSSAGGRSSRSSWRGYILAIWRRVRANRRTETPLWILQPMNGANLPIALRSEDIRVGSDPARVDVCLSDPSLSPWHARFTRQADGTWWVFDMGSVAGTWVNWEEVPENGRAFKEGDILHLGRVAFTICAPIKQPMD
jgi:hypothetical protein